MKKIIIAFVLIAFVKVQAQDHNEANYDESKVPEYTLPDVLKTSTNTEVKSKITWEKVRRPEILELFEANIYGQMPKTYDSIRYSLTNEDLAAMNGKARMKEVRIEVFNNNESVQIDLVLFVPSEFKNPAPAFLLINNRSKRNTSPTRDTISGFWPAEEIIKAGYAAAAFQVDDAAPDNEDTYTKGVLKLYPEQLQMKNGMKAIGAWAWAASRVMDYFEQDNDIDASEVVVVGHSRGGKASLWAAAEDQRFAICVANNSGNTGAALSRREFGETVEIINTSFPHWFSQNYKKYNGNVQDLPVDQHMLIGLIAPRPVYVTSASKDLWADPKGMFLSMKEAEPVYELYDLQSSLPEMQPFMNRPIINSPLGYHLRDGGHNLTVYDWDNLLKFANFHLEKDQE